MINEDCSFIIFLEVNEKARDKMYQLDRYCGSATLSLTCNLPNVQNNMYYILMNTAAHMRQFITCVLIILSLITTKKLDFHFINIKIHNY